MRLFVTFGLIPTVVLVAISAGLSKFKWDYYFSRPGVFSEVKEARNLKSVSLVEKVASGEWAIRSDTTVEKSIDLARKYSYDMPHARSLLAMQKQGLNVLNDQIPGVDTLTIDAVLREISKTVPEGEGVYYDTSKTLRGVIAVIDTEKQKDLVVASFASGQLSNDHYAFRELLFQKSPELRAIDQIKFNYDIAGMEGVEFPLILLLLFIPVSILTAAGLGLTMLVKTLRRPAVL